MNKALVGICIAGAALVSGCDPEPKSTRIIERIPSPDGTRDAVYAEDMGGGATVGPSEQVYVVAKGRFPRFQDRIFSEERVCNLTVRWLNNQAILSGYSARTAKSEESTRAGGVDVHTKWLGRDAASGC